MASEEWNSIDRKTIEFKNQYCAFLDILGFREKSKQFFLNQFNLPERILRAMSRFKNLEPITNSFNKISTKIFSDSIILTCDKNPVDIIALLNYTAALTAFFSYEGLFLRGGVSEGQYYEATDDNYSFFSSEALIKAYELENEAKFPMIVLDNELTNQFDLGLDLIIKFDSKYLLNFGRYVIDEKGKNQEMVIAEITEIIEYSKSLHNENIKEKYDWLINYYLWFVRRSHIRFNRFNLNDFESLFLYSNNKYSFVNCC